MTPLSKRLLIALVVSGALNLLLGGIFVGTAIHRSRARAERIQFTPGAHGSAKGEGRPRDDGARDGPRRGERGPRDERSLREGRVHRRDGGFGGLFAGRPEAMQARREATKTAREAVRTALTREPFEPAALEQSLTSLRRETATTQELLHTTIIENARTADADARRKLARGFERWGEGL